jgi:hypothetical protein
MRCETRGDAWFVVAALPAVPALLVAMPDEKPSPGRLHGDGFSRRCADPMMRGPMMRVPG